MDVEDINNMIFDSVAKFGTIDSSLMTIRAALPKINFENNGFFYINKKHKNLYTVVCTAINCTNDADGQELVLYTNGDMLFAREKSEFLEKFEAVSKPCDKCMFNTSELEENQAINKCTECYSQKYKDFIYKE